MRIENEYTFSGSPAKVWDLLRAPAVMAKAMPGTEKLEQIGDNRYEGVMRVGVGPVSGLFSIKIQLQDERPPESYAMDIAAKGAPGFVTGKARVTLAEHDGGTTLMRYDAELRIGGKLAIVGQRLLDTVGKSMIKQGLDALNQALEERLAADE